MVTLVCNHTHPILAHSTLVTAVNQLCLQRALHYPGTGSDSVDRLLLSLIFHCAKDDDHTRGINTLDTAFTCTWSYYSDSSLANPDRQICTAVVEAEVELRSIPTTACLTVRFSF